MKLEPLENEKWVWAKTFKGEYPNYLVSDMGRCYNTKYNRFIGHWFNGYFKVGLSKSKKETEDMIVGRLMLTSFGVPIPEHLKDLPTSKLHCMHLDGNRKNNSLSNFAWGDSNENNNEENYKRRNSEARKGDKCYMYGRYGKDCPNSKPVIQYSKGGEFIRYWDSATDVERELGINQGNISLCAKGRRHSAGGYVWKYKEEVA